MKSTRTFFPVFGLVVVLAGCSGAANAETNPATTQQADTTQEQPKGHVAGRPHHGGPDFLVFAALHENIGLSADQRAKVEALVTKDRPAAPPAPDKAKVAALASAIRAGSVDATALGPKPDDATMKAHQAAVASKLAALHDALTKDQRAALVTAVTSKKHEARPEQHGPERGGPMGHMLEGLGLTQAQKDEIEAKLVADRPAPPTEAQRAAMKQEMDARLQSFVSDSFDATAFVAPPASAPKLGADHMAKALSAIVSVLDANQREQLAQRIEQGPPARR